VKIAVAIVAGVVIAFVLLVIVVDRFILTPTPTTTPARAK
jgi:hypothetical protein